MANVLGYFMLTDLGDGCLGSKYGNIIINKLLSESAIAIWLSNPPGLFWVYMNRPGLIVRVADR
jgi:hypothetical protein